MKTVNFNDLDKGMETSAGLIKHNQEGRIEDIAALFKALTEYSSGVVVLYGCEFTKSGSDYTMTSGAVYYNGRIYSVDSFSGTAPSGEVPVFKEDLQYIGNKALFGDSQYRDIKEVYKMSVEFGAPGSGLADWDGTLSFPRLAGGIFTEGIVTGNQRLKTDVIEIGSWDMQANDVTYVNLRTDDPNFEFGKRIRAIDALILDDGSSKYPMPLEGFLDHLYSSQGGSIDQIGSEPPSTTNVKLRRNPNGHFNNSSYTNTSINRGWVTITYIA